MFINWNRWNVWRITDALTVGHRSTFLYSHDSLSFGRFFVISFRKGCSEFQINDFVRGRRKPGPRHRKNYLTHTASETLAASHNCPSEARMRHMACMSDTIPPTALTCRSLPLTSKFNFCETWVIHHE